MLVKFDADEDFVEALKSATGNNTASKAFQEASAKYLKQIDTIEYLQALVLKLRDQVSAQHQIISSARDAAAMLVERTSQDDLFIDQPSSARQIHTHSL